MTEAIFVSKNEYSIAIWDYYAIYRFIVYEKWWKKCDQNNSFETIMPYNDHFCVFDISWTLHIWPSTF